MVEKLSKWRDSVGTVGQGCEHGGVVRLFSSNKGPHIGMYFFRSQSTHWHVTNLLKRLRDLGDLSNCGCHDIVERVSRMASSDSLMADVMSKIEACQRQLT